MDGFALPSAAVRPAAEGYPNNSRTIPEQLSNNSRTIVEQLPNGCRTTVEEVAVIGSDLCQLLPITAKSFRGGLPGLRLYPESGNTGIKMLSGVTNRIFTA